MMKHDIKIQAEPSLVDMMSCSFTIDRQVYEDGAAFFGNREEAQGSPLAEKLFNLDVDEVLISGNVVKVTLSVFHEWHDYARQIGTIIREHIQSGQIAVSPRFKEKLPSPEEIRAKVERILNEEINPMVASHGGMIALHDVKGNNLYIELGGGCQGCGMARVTLRQGVERLIREKIPEVGEIFDITDHAGGRNPYYAH